MEDIRTVYENGYIMPWHASAKAASVATQESLKNVRYTV